jgi:hypothetical protein
MLIRVFFALLSTASLLNCTACGQEPRTATTNPSDPSTGSSLTIYSSADPASFNPQQLAQQRAANPYYAWQYKLPGYGVVRQTRKIEMSAGENTVRFSDVATGIDPTTVSFKSLTDATATVLEQNYEYDVVSADKLLQKYVGKRVSGTKKADPAGGNGAREAVAGLLLSFDASNLVLQTETSGVQILSRADLSGISLIEAGTDLVTQPTLVWKVATTKAGQHATQVTYQTDGLTWRADYNITIRKDDNAADIGAWVSILNESGAAYPDAHIKLVAGDVQRIETQQNQYSPMAAAKAVRAFDDASTAGFVEKSFFEYHLYTLGRIASLANNSTKQIELFTPKSSVPVTKTFVYYGLAEQWRYYVAGSPGMDRNLGSDSNKKVDIYLQIQNSEKNGFGIPLPAGRIRVYKRDETDQSAEFIGEDVIQHTPKDEKVLVKLGSAFDIVGERKQTDFNVNYNGHEMTESFEIKLRNHKTEPVDVIIKENLFRWANWDIAHCSDKWEKQDYRTIHIPVHVEKDGEKTVTYTVKYTW